MGSGAKVWGRDVALDAWEKLAEYELLVPLSIGGGNTRGQDSGASGRMWKIDVGLEEIAGSVVGLSGVMSKCKAYAAHFLEGVRPFEAHDAL
ncbi:hypothetical protein M7I_6880 [Glarea lozoyensis 74030]|uniref:Origin recognition complex subunit 4 C-terminal domain-containing protein n=1 Tax=Glarea lozoyensis (strain ATCC 74030 / MF5533) TaxID=1104152 RepID=H0EVS5_GLAL7|nr:hypothetical protein M7I_6880 [Glarea lozoyensis 74030]